MIIKDYSDKYVEPIALALGYFDSIHNGHKLLIDSCVQSGYLPTVFTFANNPFDILNMPKKQVFTYQERLLRLEELGVKMCVSATFDRAFMDMDGYAFVDKLLENYNIKLIVVGEDYTCGARASVDSASLRAYLNAKGVEVKVLPLLYSGGEKLASTKARELIQLGDVESINKILPLPYFVLGKVEHGRNDGGKVLGFPTANISFDKEKLILKEGVYQTKIGINGVEYPAITNVGNHPTFDDYHYNIESFILDFDGDIYDTNIKVVFVRRLRDTVKFNNVTELRAQITTDIARIKAWQE